MTIDADLLLPLPTLASDAGASMDASLPMVILETIYADGSLPLRTMEATASNTYNFVEGDLPLLTADGTGFGGGSASCDDVLPSKLAEATAPPQAEIVLPSLTLEATGLVGTVLSLDAVLPAVTTEGTASAQSIGSVDAMLAAIRLSATALSENFGSLERPLPSRQLVATGLSGSTSSAELVLPAITLDALGYGPYIATLEESLPALVLEASAVAAVAVATRTWVLNLRNKALTEYDSYDFNSYARLNGVLLSASTAGLFTLASQDDDAGADIDALIRTGKETFGTSYNKRVPRIYAGYKTDGAVKFTTVTSQDGRRSYLLPDNQIRAIQQRRVPVGRGPKSPYWQFEVSNVEGSDFLLEHIHVYPEKSRRRVV